MAPSIEQLAAWPSEVLRNDVELRRGELARRHDKIGVLDRSQSRDVTLDRHVVGRVGEHHVRLVGPQHTGVALGLQRVAAEQAMLAKKPKVAHAGHRRGRRSSISGSSSSSSRPPPSREDVDLADLEAADFEIDLRRKFQDLGELEGERLAVPCGILGDPIERQPQHPQLGLGQVGQTDRRHLAEAQLPCGQHQSPARNDPPLGVDQDRQNETEPLEARRELAHLLRRVLAGLPPQGLAARDRDKLGSQITRKRVAISARAAARPRLLVLLHFIRAPMDPPNRSSSFRPSVLTPGVCPVMRFRAATG